MKTKTILLELASLSNLNTIQDFFDAFVPSKKYQHLLIQNKWITLDGNFVKRETALTGKQLEIVLYPNIYPQKERQSRLLLEILYEDDLLLAVNKPTGLLVHSDGSNALTLCDLVEDYYAKTKQMIHAKPLHRLDIDTSGIVLFSKSEIFQPLFDSMLSKKQIYRDYWALVKGVIDKEVIIEKPIGKDRHNAKKMRISQNGQYAKTIITPVSIHHKQNCTLVSCHLETGRTHQIRVHLASIHHPIINDKLYGTPSKLTTRLALHAYKLTFLHPFTNKEVIIECPLSTFFLK